MLLTEKKSDQTSTQNNVRGYRLLCYGYFLYDYLFLFPLQCHKMSRKICRCTWYALFMSVCLSVRLSVCVASYAQLITQFEIWSVCSFSLWPFMRPSVFINNNTGQIILKNVPTKIFIYRLVSRLCVFSIQIELKWHSLEHHTIVPSWQPGVVIASQMYCFQKDTKCNRG